MDLHIFIVQNKLFARARARIVRARTRQSGRQACLPAGRFESIKKLMLLSTILTLLPAAAYSAPKSNAQAKLDANANLFLHKGAAAKNQFLQQLAQETDPRIRVNILGILSACNLKSDSIAALEPSLSDADPFVRSQALITLARIGGPAAVADLIHALTNDSNVGVRG